MNEDEIKNALMRGQRAIEPSLEDTGDELVRELQTMTGVPYPPASAPGQPPHRRSGLLQSSFKKRVADLTLSLTNTADYFGFVEQGTRKMAARPSLAPLTRGSLIRKTRDNLSRDFVRAERKR